MKNNLRRMLVLMLTIWTVLPLYSQFRRDENGLVVRKNIDDLDPIELATFEHAIQILKDRSNKDPYDKTGYAWQAWVHNSNAIWVPNDGVEIPFSREDFSSDRAYYLKAATHFEGKTQEAKLIRPGNCVHRSREFLFWHRAQFYYFERVLQETDPEGAIADSKGDVYATKHIGVPFWNYSLKPKNGGIRYPKAFENKESVLYHKFRAVNSTTDAPPAVSRVHFWEVTQERNWKKFGGWFGSGQFEGELHNTVHYDFVGGAGRPVVEGLRPSMVHDSQAAYDPIFYAFHAYIDYALDYWLEENGHSQITFGNSELRGTQDSRYHPQGYERCGNEECMGTVKLYLSSKALGYKYEPGENDGPLRTDVNEFLVSTGSKKSVTFGKSKISPSYQIIAQNSSFEPFEAAAEVRTVSVSIDEIEEQSGVITIPLDSDPTLSYQIDAYLYPDKKRLKIKSEAFRKKFFAGFTSTWTGSHGGHHSVLTIDLSSVLEFIPERDRSGEFELSFNITEI